MKQENLSQGNALIKHPFAIILGVITIFYYGYLFGQFIFKLAH